MISRFRSLLAFLGVSLTACITSAPNGGAAAPATKPAASPTHAKGKAYVWPNGASAAVSLTYDDAIPSQLDNAAPALARYGLVATFFLTGSSPTVQGSPERYRDLVRAGHELASHTMTHPCDRGLGFMQPGMALQDFDQARMDAELVESTKQLRDLGQTGPLSFAYPCGSTWLGEPRTSYIPLIEKSFVAARGVSGSVVDPRHARLFDVPSVMGNTGAAALTNWVDSALSSGGWVVFTFHGVAGDYLPVEASAHEALLSYLEQHKKTIWTDRLRLTEQAHAFPKQGAGGPAVTSRACANASLPPRAEGAARPHQRRVGSPQRLQSPKRIFADEL